MKLSKRLFAIGLALLGVVVLLLSPYFEKVSRKSQTVTLLNSLHKMDQLEVLEAELVTYKTYASQSYLGLNQNAFVVFAQGRAQFGVSMSQVKLIEQEDAMHVYLPRVLLLRVYLVPGSLEYVGLQKGWFTSQTTFEDLKKEALKQLETDLAQKARKTDYTQRAQKNVESILTPILKQAGVKKPLAFHFEGSPTLRDLPAPSH